MEKLALIIPQPCIDWNAGELRSAPCLSNPRRRDRFYKVDCPQCKTPRWLRKHDAKKGSVCSNCQRSAAGARGYAAMLQKHGRERTLEAIQQRERLHPSQPEFLTRLYLHELGYRPVCQVRFNCWLIDLVIDNHAIEVNGYWHQRTRQDRDRQLAQLWHGPILFLDADRIINDPISTKIALLAFLTGEKIQ